MARHHCKRVRRSAVHVVVVLMCACPVAGEVPREQGGGRQPPGAIAEVTTPKLTSGSAVLLSVRTHPGDAATTYSFLGTARPAKGANARSGGDIQFDRAVGELSARKHTGDRSTIVDLGPKTWDQIDSLPQVRAADTYSAPAKAGHAYLIRINDTE
jgi:hypothetical protein